MSIKLKSLKDHYLPIISGVVGESIPHLPSILPHLTERYMSMTLFIFSIRNQAG